VLTHHTRPTISLGDTTFHFVDADLASVLDLARDAAQSKDVRLGGRATTIRQFLDATSSTPCTWRSRKWNSDPDHGSENHPMSCSTYSTSTSCHARVA
jgi:hypothetical protein